ncbi:MAG: prepilin-type N-terminal cleavage/methylation domain-containing protein [Candidatus Riflebacteria bacterium]|nr:prepilin-type N-terminal cleavage/methylation domain-containing protein [Candidatus Riflebacteria bacterium]
MMRQGFSLIESMIAIFLFSCMLFPIMSLMTQTTKMTPVSFIELQALRYTTELLSQITNLHRTSNALKLISSESRKSIPEIIENLNSIPEFYFPKANEKQINPGLKQFKCMQIFLDKSCFCLILSKLETPFVQRAIRVKSIDCGLKNHEKVYMLTASVSWNRDKSSVTPPVQKFEMTAFLTEN